MNYELAKKLAQHGFPQETKEHYITDEDGGMVRVCYMESPIHRKMDVMYDYTAKPSLSELIEACGDNLVEIKRVANTHGIIWRANGNNNPKNYPDWGYSMAGSTPEEAVANLWLELNKK